MKITQMTYEYLKNLGNFQNEKLSVTVILEENQQPEVVLNEVRLWVGTQLNLRTDIRELKQQKQELEREIRSLKGELNTIRYQLQRISQKFHDEETNEIRHQVPESDLSTEGDFWTESRSAA